jgi:DNA-binding MarR family transcriptional regulator
MSAAHKISQMSRIGVIFLTWRRCLQKRILPHGITLKQLYVLRRLQVKEVLYPSDIASLLFCDRPTATSILNTMKRKGWIMSAQDPLNMKKQRVILTDAGKEKVYSLSGFSLEPAFDPMACFTEEERSQFDILLQKLAAHMKNLPNE